MDSMMLQEILILVLSIAALGGGTACIVIRDRRWNRQDDDGKKNVGKKRSRNVKFIPQNHTV